MRAPYGVQSYDLIPLVILDEPGLSRSHASSSSIYIARSRGDYDPQLIDWVHIQETVVCMRCFTHRSSVNTLTAICLIVWGVVTPSCFPKRKLHCLYPLDIAQFRAGHELRERKNPFTSAGVADENIRCSCSHQPK